MSYCCHRGLDLSFHTAPSKPLLNLLHIVKQVHQEIHSVDHMKLHSILGNDECFLSMSDTVCLQKCVCQKYLAGMTQNTL